MKEMIRLLHNRATIRHYKPDPVPDQVMDEILTAGIRGATGGNMQPFSIIKITEQSTRDRLSKMCWNQSFISTAPVSLLFCLDFHRLQRWAKLQTAPFTADASFAHFWIALQDTIISAQNICTAADALGLGSVYVGAILLCLDELRNMFKLPETVFPVVMVCLGYPLFRPEPRRKLPVDVIVHDGEYKQLTDDELLRVFADKYPEGLEISEQRLNQIESVCEQVHGREFADQVVESIKEQGCINPAQVYFGLHYRADNASQGNNQYLQQLRQAGFKWLNDQK